LGGALFLLQNNEKSSDTDIKKSNKKVLLLFKVKEERSDGVISLKEQIHSRWAGVADARFLQIADPPFL
jgi:hypothetical protein